jgi:hypothetical protein
LSRIKIIPNIYSFVIFPNGNEEITKEIYIKRKFPINFLLHIFIFFINRAKVISSAHPILEY